MKDHMLTHVRGEAAVMFKAATDAVRESLKQMCRDVDAGMAEHTDAVFTEMRKDYMNVIAGVKLPEGYVMPKSERLMRDEVTQKLKGAEALFMAGSTEETQAENRGDNCNDSNGDEMFVASAANRDLEEEPTEASGSRTSLANDSRVASPVNKYGNVEDAAKEAVREHEPTLNVEDEQMPDIIDDADQDPNFQDDEGFAHNNRQNSSDMED
jgi:hypothetical protein